MEAQAQKNTKRHAEFVDASRQGEAGQFHTRRSVCAAWAIDSYRKFSLRWGCCYDTTSCKEEEGVGPSNGTSNNLHDPEGGSVSDGEGNFDTMAGGGAESWAWNILIGRQKNLLRGERKGDCIND